jgi:hypothetical protein
MSQLTANRTIETGTTHLLCRIEDGVAVLTLNRPESRNALSTEMTPALRRLLAVKAFIEKRRPVFRGR